MQEGFTAVAGLPGSELGTASLTGPTLVPMRVDPFRVVRLV